MNNKRDVSRHVTKKHQENFELEEPTQKQKEKPQSAADIPRHKSNIMDEAARIETREFMKRQREKRKLVTSKTEIDKTIVIKKRLDELRRTTQNVIQNPKKKNSQKKISPPKDFYSANSIRMKDIKVLRLKATPRSQASLKELKLSVEKITNDQRPIGVSPMAISSPNQHLSPQKKASPSLMRKAVMQANKPLPPRNLQILSQTEKVNHHVPEASQKHSRPSSSKENKRPIDIKLKVPDLKLSMSSLNRTELPPAVFQQKIPFWLQNTSIQPFPYNFIFAVRKKLEAYTSAEEAKPPIQQRAKVGSTFDTPHLKTNGQLLKKGRIFLERIQADETEFKLKQISLTDDSAAIVKFVEHELNSEANTISEISSIKSDPAQVKSKSYQTKNDHFRSPKDDTFNSDVFTSSLEKKRINFLSSTLQTDMNNANDLDKNKLNEEYEEGMKYQNMLTAFNKSLKNVIEVNQIISKSSETVISSKPSENYTSSFENNPDSEETQKPSDEISEVVENFVKSQPAVRRTAELISESNSSIKTFIEDSKSITFKPNKVEYDAIEDPPIIYEEQAVQEFSSSSTKLTATMIVHQKLAYENEENTLNESMLLNMFSEAEVSFNIVHNNESFGMVSFCIISNSISGFLSEFCPNS